MNNDIQDNLSDENTHPYPDARLNEGLLWRLIAEDGVIITQRQAEALHALPDDCTLGDGRLLLGVMRLANAHHVWCGGARESSAEERTFVRPHTPDEKI